MIKLLIQTIIKYTSVRTVLILTQSTFIIFLIFIIFNSNPINNNIYYDYGNIISDNNITLIKSDGIQNIKLPTYVIDNNDIEKIKAMKLNPVGTLTSTDYYSEKINNSTSKETRILYQKAYDYNLGLLSKYTKSYLYFAKLHEKTYKIPFEISLGQALLESNTGQSKLARKYNNHFGEKSHKKSEPRVFTKVPSEPKKCFFRTFKTVSKSFEGHSKKLLTSRYKDCFECNKTYSKDRKKMLECWAKNLSKCGYATDKKYAPKLIKIISSLELSRLKR